VAICPSCGEENPKRAKFCLECGAPLGATTGAWGEERRVVTVVFFDLAGFTARSETLDPEDVRAFLVPFYELVAEEAERHGGKVDKFLGDGALVAFGVPVAHEDDPERALRTGLRVLERLPSLGLELRARCGVNTGEVLVALDRLESGEALTGDTVNTAARLQTVAPPGGVVVGERTWRAAETAFEFEELEPAELKGKSEPVRVFRVVGVRERAPDLPERRGTVFVGRESELSRLREAFDEALGSRSARLITVVGEPGLGKSRLIAELRESLDAHTVTWRTGRCLPYGEGITYWPFREIVNAHAGILESDEVEVAERKLLDALPEGPERPWLRERMLPLLGFESSSTARPDELHAAWRQFVEHVAAEGPVVLVFEDLHWAEEGLLAFVESLAVAAVPLLVVGTARPELFTRALEFLPDAPRIDLAPLSESETGRLVAGLLETVMLPAEVQRPILERAAGNPLYAEEFVRLLRDRGLIVRRAATWELAGEGELPLPDSLHALIAARLDLLSAEEAAVLADASVVGREFWPGAVAQMGGREAGAVLTILARLAARELLRPGRTSSIEGELEYSFWHALVRDVAYGRLPRRARASRHLAVARWIEEAAGTRVEELAGVLAHHYLTAADLFRAAREAERASEAEAGALRFLVLAGERALGFDTPAAYANLARAVELTPPGHPDRPAVLARFGEAAVHAGEWQQAAPALREAITALRQRGDPRAAAGFLAPAAAAFGQVGSPEGETLPVDLLAELEPLGPTPELTLVLTEHARAETFAGRPERALALLERALGNAAEVGQTVPARTLGYLGVTRGDLGDERGLDDLRTALELATAAGEGREVALLYTNLAGRVAEFQGPAAATEIFRQGIAYATPRGLLRAGVGLVPFLRLFLVDAGAHDEVLPELREAIAAAEADGSSEGVAFWRLLAVRILLLRGEASACAEWLDEMERHLRQEDLQGVVMGLVHVSAARAALGQADAARSILTEVATRPDVRAAPQYVSHLPVLARTAVALGEVDLGDRLLEGGEAWTPNDEHSLLAARAVLVEGHGDIAAAAELYLDAARRWAGFAAPVEEAYARLGAGRCLLALGRTADARTALERARSLWTDLKASPLLAETDALLEGAVSLSA
jgi:class 3 adenylate cyclase/tetratricopeptide (TPR) repeat protein